VTEPVSRVWSCNCRWGLLLELRTLAGEDKIILVSIVTKYSLSIVVGVAVAVSNIGVLSAAMGLQQLVRFVLSPS